MALPLVDARSIALSITTAAPGADGVDLPHWELALRAIMESQQNQSDSEGLP